MSKYSKHLDDKNRLRQLKQMNRQYAEEHRQKMSKVQDRVDNRSTYETFCQWCEECGEELYPDFYGVLSIAGSDGTDMSPSHFGGVPYNKPEAVNQMLEDDGYYKEGWVNMNSFFYHKPKMTYLEWFNKKFNVNQ